MLPEPTSPIAGRVSRHRVGAEPADHVDGIRDKARYDRTCLRKPVVLSSIDRVKG